MWYKEGGNVNKSCQIFIQVLSNAIISHSMDHNLWWNQNLANTLLRRQMYFGNPAIQCFDSV